MKTLTLTRPRSNPIPHADPVGQLGHPPGRPRIALYGHDTVGLGHLRRNLALAGAFAAMDPRPDVLVLTAVPEATAFDLPPGVDIVTMPSVTKATDGTYASGRLDTDLGHVIDIRKAILGAALRQFSPDLLVVDKVARGLAGELEPALAELRTLHGTRIVLGLRDVLDDAETAAAEWRAQRGTETVRAYYDELWVYGDRRIHDVAVACALPPAIAARATYLGYLALGRQDREPHRPPMLPADQPYALCTVGGGVDGGALARAFASTLLPAGVAGILVTGPQMPSAEQAAIADAATESGTELHVVDFHPSLARWLPGAAAIVAMGGYNTVAEIVATDVPALVVPRHHPRLEQRIRAEELGRHGLLDWLHPKLASPDTLGTWLAEAVERGPTSRTELSRDGLVAARTRATELLRMEAADVAL